MTANIDLHAPEPPGDGQGGATASRVRVLIAGVTVDIELNNGTPAHQSPHQSAPPVAAPRQETVTSQAEPAAPAVQAHHVRSPIVGTFYQSPEPGAAPFVSVGDEVTAGQQIGIVEAMKLMNRIDADVSGRVVAVLVPDGTPVEYDRPLIALATE